MPTRNPDDDRINLLQGTLDLLILRTLLFGREHGQGIARAIQSMSEMNFLSIMVRYTRRCSDLSPRGGLMRNGVRAVTTERRVSIV